VKQSLARPLETWQTQPRTLRMVNGRPRTNRADRGDRAWAMRAEGRQTQQQSNEHGDLGGTTEPRTERERGWGRFTTSRTLQLLGTLALFTLEHLDVPGTVDTSSTLQVTAAMGGWVACQVTGGSGKGWGGGSPCTASSPLANKLLVVRQGQSDLCLGLQGHNHLTTVQSIHKAHL
jgi:hypothetical protein